MKKSSTTLLWVAEPTTQTAHRLLLKSHAKITGSFRFRHHSGCELPTTSAQLFWVPLKLFKLRQAELLQGGTAKTTNLQDKLCFTPPWAYEVSNVY